MMNDISIIYKSMMENPLPYALAVLISVFFVYRWTRKPFPTAIPFPFNQTVLGDLLYFIIVVKVFYNGDSQAYYRSLRKRFGDVFYLGPLFSQPHSCPNLVVMHPDDQAAIIKKEKDLQLVVNLPDTAMLIHGERNFQNLPVGQTHGALRKVFSSILSPKSLEEFTATMIEYFQKMWNDLEQKESESRIQHAIRETQLRLMCKLLYGFGEETEEERKILDQFMKDFALTEKALFDLNGTTGKDFKAGFEAKKRISKILDKKFESIFDKRIAEIKNGKHEKDNKECLSGSAMEQIVDVLIRSGCTDKKKTVGEVVSYEDAKDNLYLLLEASHGTTMYVTTSMMYFLNRSDSQDSLERLRKEVTCLEPTYQSLKTFSYGNACVQETMRMAPIIGTVPYYIPEGKTFMMKGKSIQGPIVVSLNSSNWYMDDKVFDDASSFQPERWLSGEKEVTEFAKSIFRPFGFGRHLCLGYPLAKLVMNANLYCFASKRNRSIVFDEDKVKIENGIFPEKKVKGEFVGKVVVD